MGSCGENEEVDVVGAEKNGFRADFWSGLPPSSTTRLLPSPALPCSALPSPCSRRL